ncbi:MAG: nucleotidyltransferase family protein [Xanthomonadales bacterium]|nr:nucleotidyltransferase family protein [Xanthomonadales bacterium]
MRALIFAAGRGERMRPLTDTTPKPLLEVGGKPLVVWHIERLRAIGVHDIVINTSWLAPCFPQRLGDGSGFGVHLHFSHEGETALETGGGMRHALSLLGDAPFIALNGDIWSTHPLATLPREPQGLAHCVLVPLPAFRTPAAFEQTVTPLLGADAPAHTLAGIGVYRPELVRTHTPGKFSITPLLTAVANTGQLSVEAHCGEWEDVGTQERLRALDTRLTTALQQDLSATNR